ncbi:MAG TPA: substrate-binding domain-containing protein [Candidatus Limnocylindria bacterium]|jgi:ribose transport system substrate-binding protein|nr:substrate-binding domain-containing protein [Candidatus Limnocylindria bacterium]
MNRRSFLLASAALPLVPSLAAHAETAKSYTFGLIAKSQGNAVFQVARVGAEDAARELGAKHGLKIRIDWRTPNDEDAQKQAEALEQLVLAGADGIAISCSDANKVTDAINKAVKNGVPVCTFDSDAPASKRFVTYGVDDLECGRQVMIELAKVMGGKGVVAILAGNQNAPNLQKRAQGVRDEARQYPGITIRDTYYHRETPQDAAAKIEQVMQANPDITGWALIGGWPLFTENALHWAPGVVKCVSVDALPAQLAYIRSGHVQKLLAQQCHAWGYRSVELLLDKVHFHKNPPAVKEVSPLVPVDKSNVDAYAKNWEKWLPK